MRKNTLHLLLAAFLLTCLGCWRYTPSGRYREAIAELKSAKTEQDRFYALNQAAKSSYEMGKIDDAGNFAKELLRLAHTYQKDWNYGNAVQDGNIVLGRIAARNGNLSLASSHLFEAGKSPGSPQMNSFGPNMSLALDLLTRGQSDPVLKYFEQCRKFWELHDGKLDKWSSEVRAGKIPDFGANLVY